MPPSKPRGVYPQSSEETPLLPAGSSTTDDDGAIPTQNTDSLSPSPPVSSSPPRRRASILSLIFLCISMLVILCVGFFAPAAASQYTKEAVILDVSSLSIEEFTTHGMRARIQASVIIDAGRVKNGIIRSFGRVGTWLAQKVSSEQSTVHVYLPDYDSGLLGTATVPAMVINIRNGQMTLVDFVSEIETGSLDVVRRVANDYLNGRLGLVRVYGEANLVLKAGLLKLGTQKVSEELAFEEIPSLPNFQVNRLSFGEAALPNQKAINANISITIKNQYPLKFEIPSLPFTVLLPGCETHDLVSIAIAETSHLLVEPKTDIDMDISAIIHDLPDDFVSACPKSHTSPIDKFLGSYLHGNDTTVFIRGASSPKRDAPKWLLEFLQRITLPVPFPGYTFDNVVKSFSLSGVKFRLPAPDAKPGSPESSPRLNASVTAIIQLPEEINFPINVKRIRAIADVSYEGKKFGTLDLYKWITANSTHYSNNKYLEVHAEVGNAPLDVTDYDVFESVVRKLVFGKEPLQLGIKGDTDVDINTSLGEFVVSNIPTIGNIAIDSFPGFGLMPSLRAHKVVIEETTPHSVSLHISISINNPTPWEVIVPYMNINITNQDMVLGNASISSLQVLPGDNTFTVWVIWDPRTHGGDEAERIGAQFLSEYVSGRNTTLTIRPHAGSLPSLPSLSRALANFQVTIPTPSLGKIGDSDDTPPRFIESATIHILSSTADFIVSNPLRYNRITVDRINGTAKYNGSDLGTILYELPFDILAGKKGKTLTPRLPVDWGPDNLGYGVVKKALSGQLKVHAEALCLVGVGNFSIELFYNGSKAIGAHVGF